MTAVRKRQARVATLPDMVQRERAMLLDLGIARSAEQADLAGTPNVSEEEND